MNEQKSIDIGFSVNVEQLWLPEGIGEKRKLGKMKFGLGGSSINIHQALKAFGVKSSVLAFIANPEHLAPDDLIVRAITEQVISNEEKRGLTITKLPVLSRDNYAIKEYETEHTYGYKGTLQDTTQVEQFLTAHRNHTDGKICTGIQLDEIRFAKLMLRQTAESKSLNLKPSVLGNKEVLKDILPYCDFLFMNEAEYKLCKLDTNEMHKLGVSFIAITKGANGVTWSFKGNRDWEEVQGVTVSSNEKLFTTGCGDWFHGAFRGALIRLGYDSKNLTLSQVKTAVKIANIVAAEKTKFRASSLGPDQDFVSSVISEITA